MQSQYRRILETSLGQIEMQDIGAYSLLPHEYLSHQVSNTSIGDVNITTYHNHLKNPFNTTNTSISSTLFLHQIQHITKPLIIDVSNSKDLSGYKNIHIVKGSKINIQPISKQEGDYLYSKQTIKQNIQNNLILNQPKASFVGELVLPQIDLTNQYHLNYIHAAFQVCKQRGCFVLFNMISNKASQTIFHDDNTNYIKQIYDKILKIIQINQKYNAKILLFNPLVLFYTKIQSNRVIKQYQNYQVIRQIRNKNVVIGYDFSRYEKDRDFIGLLINQINQYPDTTVLSTGILYKTDLVSFGGSGWKNSEAFNYLESHISTHNIEKVRRNNIIGLLFWKTEQIVVKMVEYWRCSTCDKQFSEYTQKFRKLGKQFCNTACIRGYKF